MDTQDDYAIKLDVFEGPLDLLLYLIKKNEVDIYDIPIELVTRQYMNYLQLMKMLDLNVAGEFIVMSATLMMIKSRMLLPEEERPELEEEEEDPRLDLVRQLVEYKKFKDAADHLDDLELSQQNVFLREGEGVELGKDASLGLKDVSIFDLISAFNTVLAKARKEDLAEIFTDQFTVAEKIDHLIHLIERKARVSLSEVFKGMKFRQEVICTFLAMLELIRLKRVRAVQEDAQHGEIEIIRTDDGEE